MRKVTNEYEVCGDVVTLNIRDGERLKLRVLFDADDIGKVRQHHWNATADGYAVNYRWGAKNLLMHRLIAETPEGLETDHINHDKADNRKANLRNVTKSMNARNRKAATNIRNTGRGPHPIYTVYFNVWGRMRYFGHFQTRAEAEARRDEVSRLLNAGFDVEPIKTPPMTNRNKGKSGERYISERWGKFIVAFRNHHIGCFPTMAEAKEARDNALKEGTNEQTN